MADVSDPTELELDDNRPLASDEVVDGDDRINDLDSTSAPHESSSVEDD